MLDASPQLPSLNKAHPRIRGHIQTILSSLASSNGRIPIFAVSASLVEQKHDKYVRDGFDRWVLKPINFRHSDTLMMGIGIVDERRNSVYRLGMRESSGWLQVGLGLKNRD